MSFDGSLLERSQLTLSTLAGSGSLAARLENAWLSGLLVVSPAEMLPEFRVRLDNARLVLSSRGVERVTVAEAVAAMTDEACQRIALELVSLSCGVLIAYGEARARGEQ